MSLAEAQISRGGGSNSASCDKVLKLPVSFFLGGGRGANIKNIFSVDNKITGGSSVRRLLNINGIRNYTLELMLSVAATFYITKTFDV